MSEEQQVIDLLDRAVGEVPPELLLHRTPRSGAGCAGAARTGWAGRRAAALLAGPGSRRAAGSRRSSSGAGAPGAVGAGGAGCAVAGRADRPDRHQDHRATPPRCSASASTGTPPAANGCAVRRARHDRLDGTYTGCADDTQVAARTFALPQAVGGRASWMDRRSPAGQPFVFPTRSCRTSRPAAGARPAGVVRRRLRRPRARLVRAGGPELRVCRFRWQRVPDGRLMPTRSHDAAWTAAGRRVRPGRRPAAGWVPTTKACASRWRWPADPSKNPRSRDRPWYDLVVTTPPHRASHRGGDPRASCRGGRHRCRRVRRRPRVPVLLPRRRDLPPRCGGDRRRAVRRPGRARHRLGRRRGSGRRHVGRAGRAAVESHADRAVRGVRARRRRRDAEVSALVPRGPRVPPVAAWPASGARDDGAGLRRAAGDGLPALLETSNPGNVAVYRSVGFEVLEHLTVDPDLPVWIMHRP